MTPDGESDGPSWAHYLLDQAVARAPELGASLPFSRTTADVNTIDPEYQPHCPGDPALELRIRTINRWNVMAAISRSSRARDPGHLRAVLHGGM